MKKNRISKAKNQTYHFKKRCDKRIGTQIDRKTIQRRIKDQNYSENFYFLNRQSNRVTRYRYRFQGKWYIIPYDKNTHKVITIFEDKIQDEPETLITVNDNSITCETSSKDHKLEVSKKYKTIIIVTILVILAVALIKIIDYFLPYIAYLILKD